MRIGAITAEFNPLHRGHQYIIRQAKADCDVLIVLLSGAFTQRGEPAALSKFNRARDAVNAGADIVITHPIQSATSYGDKFTQGAVKTLLKFPNLSAIYCGIEGVDETLFYRMIALSAEVFPKSVFQEALATGSSYTEALKRAYGSLDPAFETLFRPNAILALGYGRALAEENALPLFRLIPRICEDIEGPLPSASQIRRWRDEADERAETASVATPPQWSVASLMEKLYPLYRTHALGKMKDLSLYDGYEVGLENRIERILREERTYADFIAAATTKRYAAPRIQRLLLHYTLGLTSTDIDDAIEQQMAFQLLALSHDGRGYLRMLKETPIQLIQNFSKVRELPNAQKKYLEAEERGSILQEILTGGETNQDYISEIYYRK